MSTRYESPAKLFGAHSYEICTVLNVSVYTLTGTELAPSYRCHAFQRSKEHRGDRGPCAVLRWGMAHVRPRPTWYSNHGFSGSAEGSGLHTHTLPRTGPVRVVFWGSSSSAVQTLSSRHFLAQACAHQTFHPFGVTSALLDPHLFPPLLSPLGILSRE